jgi:hypothetical protein
MHNMGIQVSYCTVLKALHASPYLQCKRPRKRPFMTTQQQLQRYEWAKAAAFDWNAVYYGDEKSFSLDGPDVRPRLWCDRRDKPLTLQRRGPHQGRVGFFGCFSKSHVPKLIRIPANYTSGDYCAALRQALPRRSILMHDRHPVHRSALTQREMNKRNIEGCLFPPRAADLNPIENLWGIVTGVVYSGNRVYGDETSLVHAVNEAWAAVQSNAQLRVNLVRSMPGRVADVVLHKGDFTRY